ncbi:DUF3788 family protein [Bacteroidota bacterium]
MSENVFREKDIHPSDELVKNALKTSYPYLEIIRKYIADSIGETTEEWKYYGKKLGWTMKTFYKKRNLFFIGIYEGYFMMAFIFGDKAYNALMESDLSAELKSELKSAQKYAEGRGLRLKIEDDRYLEDIKILLQYKMAK